jgi:hypothetical protein
MTIIINKAFYFSFEINTLTLPGVVAAALLILVTADLISGRDS